MGIGVFFGLMVLGVLYIRFFVHMEWYRMVSSLQVIASLCSSP